MAEECDSEEEDSVLVNAELDEEDLEILREAGLTPPSCRGGDCASMMNLKVSLSGNAQGL